MKMWNYENEQWTRLPSHLKHLPLFTRHFDLTSWVLRCMWWFFLKQMAFRFYIKMDVIGNFHEVHKKFPRLLVISNHSSHLDTACITAAIPFKYWLHLYICAAKDYWFSNPLFTFFSTHCLGAIPIDRKEKKSESIKLCTSLLSSLDYIWMLIYPEGTRSKDGYIHDFKKGISLFSESTQTPILFLYLEGTDKVMPKGKWPQPGRITIHIGPVQQPDNIKNINENYKGWVTSINPHAYKSNIHLDQ